ncbi:MAG TPA: hypothetical protein VGI74_12345 [Streptosporangiaceae bacterium]
MNKAKTGKLLSAAVLANMALAGFAASPAGASTAGTTGAKAATTAAASRGFVPKAAKGVRPDSESGCLGHVCLGLKGGGQHVSSVNEHWFTGTGCHIAHFYAFSPSGTLIRSYNPAGFWCSKQQVVWPKSKVAGSYSVGTDFCGSFNNISGFMCEPVR